MLACSSCALPFPLVKNESLLVLQTTQKLFSNICQLESLACVSFQFLADLRQDAMKITLINDDSRPLLLSSFLRATSLVFSQHTDYLVLLTRFVNNSQSHLSIPYRFFSFKDFYRRRIFPPTQWILLGILMAIPGSQWWLASLVSVLRVCKSASTIDGVKKLAVCLKVPPNIYEKS